MVNGDMDEKDEFPAVLELVPKDQLYLYLAVERFLNPYNQGHFRGMSLQEAFQKEFIDYLARNNFPLTPDERRYEYLEKVYKEYFNADLELEKLVEIHEYYLSDTGVFGKVGRATKDVRDQALLKKIDSALSRYDKVFVVFGASHRVAVEPALVEIMKKH